MTNNSSREYLKKEENSEFIEIYEKIKKKADELSTTEGSVQFFKNLSNPTNLTNPQIIGFHSSNFNNTNDLNFSDTSKEKINLNNIKLYKKHNNRNIRKELLLLRENNKKNLFEYLFKDNEEQHVEKNNIKKVEKDNLDISQHLDENKSIIKKSIILDPIWGKLMSSRNFKNNTKDTKIKIRNNNSNKSYRNYIEDDKEISKMKFIIKNKIERFEKLKKIKKSELSSVDKISSKIENYKKNIETNYNKKCISYIKFLNRQLEKERIILSDLEIDEYKIRKDIKILNKNIEKLIKEKYNILLWMSLAIQVKEKIPKIPDYYFLILEENDNYKIYKTKKKENEKENISKMEINKDKILNYKYNAIYENVDEFIKQYDILERECLKYINRHQNILSEIKILKKKLISNNGFIIKEHKNNSKYNITKYINMKLKSELKKVKSQKKVVPNRRNQINSVIRYSLSSSEINKNNIRFEGNNISNNISFDFYSNKDLYSLIMNLFYMIKQNNIIKFEDFEKNSKRDSNQLLFIMKYIEKVVQLLIDEKRKYYDNPILFRKYENLENIIKKENRKNRYQALLKIEDAKQKEKIKQIVKKINKGFYSPTRKIDYSFFSKRNKEKNKEKINIKRKSNKTQLSFQDFIYDL